MTRLEPRRILLAIAAPVLAVLVAFAITSLILIISGDPVGDVWRTILKVPSHRVIVAILNAATGYYLAAIAVAIGFRMNLFNIGTEGQYRIGAFCGAYVGGLALLPGWFNILLALVAAMLSGAIWAGIAAWLKVTRGVSEVISTIMLNSIATFLIAFLLRKVRYSGGDQNVVQTTPVPESSQLAGFKIFSDTGKTVYTLILLAVLVGVLYWFILGRTRFGFDLRATGRSESAAVASGVNGKRMVVATMLLSGAVAGLIGMPMLFAENYSYGSTFQAGLGFVGIGVALIGRNNPIGILFASLLWAFLDAQSNSLQIQANVSDKLVTVIQGVIVLSVVIAYELVRRANVKLEQRKVARELSEQSTPEPEGAAA